MRDLRLNPLWQLEDLGFPIPDSRHACSVCLPTWQSVIDYEEGRDKVVRSLQAGYPRFILLDDVASLFAKAKSECASNGQDVLVFPTREAAQRAQRFIELRGAGASEIKSFKGCFVLVFSEDSEKEARLFWRYVGEGVSSRQAKRILETGEAREKDDSARRYFADFFRSEEEDLHLWQSGMAAAYAVHRHVISERAGKKTLQVDFPYVDSLRVQQSFGAGVVFLPESNGEDLKIALQRIREREFAAVFTEVPTNPLLKTPAIAEISKACRTSQTPFIIDDTVSSHYNTDALQYADVVTTSLTKWVSGKGDVMAGCTRINPKSSFAKELRALFHDQSPLGSTLDVEDEDVLIANSAGFEERIQQINVGAEALADYFYANPLVEKTYYPKFFTQEQYENIKTPHGGYGGLISIVLKNPKKAPAFYDALRLSKGPSLGTEFSLVCPYTLLAHYEELDFAEGNKVKKSLIRFSVGTEPMDHLMVIIQEAFAAIS